MSTLPTPSILLADDDPQFLRIMEHHLRSWSYRVECVSDKARLLQSLASRRVDLLLLDVRFGEHDGVEILRQIKGDFPELRVTMLTAFGSIDNAVTAIKFGANEYLTKPVDINHLRSVLASTLDRPSEPPSPGKGTGVSRPILGESPAVRHLKAQIERVAETDATVLILGESGTGKELVARAIHEQSRRRAGPFVPLNMAALPKDLVESTLFGHAKGAFTGAEQMQSGCCEAADRGTLFLDEIGEMDAGHQAKILRFLQERSFHRVGQTTPVTVDVRIIAATNRDPIVQIRNGHLREDLYYRLNVFPIVVPPLRERREDIPLLARQFLKRACERHRRPPCELSEAALEELARRDWSGNIRELENLVERLAILNSGPTIELAEALGKLAQPGPPAAAPGGGLEPLASPRVDSRLIDRIEKEAIVSALSEAQGNVAEAAKRLGLSQATVYRKIKKFQIPLD